MREGQDPEVVRARPVEPGALHHLDLLPQQQVQDEPLVVDDGVHLRVDAREGVQRPLRLHARHPGDLVQPLPRAVALLVEAAARGDELPDRLPAAERGLDRVLRGRVGAQAHGGECGQPLQVVAGVLLRARHHHPAGAEPGHPVRLGQPAEGEAEHVRGQDRHRVVLGAVVQDLVVDLVGEDHQPVTARQVHNAVQDFPGVDGARRVVRVDDDHRPGAVGDLRGHVGEVRIPVRRLVADVVHGLAARERGHSGPQRIVGARDQHLVAVLQERLHGHGDQLGDAVAEEDVVHAGLGQSHRLVALRHGAAGGQDAARIGVAVRLGKHPDHVLDDLLGGLEAEERRIAGVQTEHAVAGLLERVRLLDDRAPDLVTDLVELAGLPELHLCLPDPGLRYLVLPSSGLESPTTCLDCVACHVSRRQRRALPAAGVTTSSVPPPGPSTPWATGGRC